MLACRTHGRAGPFAQWAWVLDVLLCSAAAGRWTRIPGEKDAQLCQRSDLETRSKMPPAKRRPFRLRTSFRGCPVPDLEPSWLHLVKGSRRGPQQVAVSRLAGPCCCCPGRGVENRCGPVPSVGQLHAAAGTFCQVPDPTPPWPVSLLLIRRMGIQGRDAPSRLVFLPFLSPRTRPQTSCWPSARPTTSTSTLSPLKPATRRPASAPSGTSTRALPTDLPSLLTAHR
jgi:hypothetical protein